MLERLREALENPVAERAAASPARNLNQYVEAQVHGGVSLETDADALVVDPAFQNTATGDDLAKLCETYELQLRWHHGFRLSCDRVPHDFRGRTMPSLAQRIAPIGTFDVSDIGAAVRELHVDPEAWKDRGSVGEVLQELKLLWHVLVRYGEPMRLE